MYLTVVRFLRPAAFGAIAAMFAAGGAKAVDVTGAGATFPNPVYQKWAEAYKAKTNNAINYQSVGSGAGIKQIESNTVDFGATDKPLTQDELQKNDLVQFPAVIGGIVMVVNLPGIKPGEIKLDGATVAKIYMGSITSWNDPAIAKTNPGTKLPDTAITVVHRSDGSGTTFNFATYLSQVDADWKDKVGANTAVEWPAGVGGKGNEGVSALVQQTAGAIGYVEIAYALQNKMVYTQMMNHDGLFVEPKLSNFQAAAANADWKSQPGYAVILANQPGKDSWPITAATFILVHGKAANAEKTHTVLDFYDWSFKNGQTMAEDLLYVPLPDSLVKQIEATWSSSVKADGKALWP
ncbi:MAG TPA: phosphate ABC transporter substrate-binding protein PstS [Alphaproteobacteria bacterium]|nr:phosphate ABC transporter substrate-binding protein PstS [Alphaproteobacteria bacterium]